MAALTRLQVMVRQHQLSIAQAWLGRYGQLVHEPRDLGVFDFLHRERKARITR